ncbi:MAG: protein translocase SEC61 complex subunit gamma [Nanoarchaeota archaeon]
MNQLAQKIVSFYHQSVRVWHVLRKPSRDEFLTVAKVSAIGILIIGFIGFLISFIVNLIK